MQRYKTVTRKKPFPVLWIVGGVFGVLVLMGGGLFVALVFNAIGKSAEAQQRGAEAEQKRVAGLPTPEELDVKLKGMTEKEVLALLGKPESTTRKMWTYDGVAKNRITGQVQYFFVHFSEDSKVEAVR